VALAMDGKALALSLRFDRIIELHRARPSHLDLPPIPDPGDIAATMAASKTALLRLLRQCRDCRDISRVILRRRRFWRLALRASESCRPARHLPGSRRNR